jgi:Tol biopolymer transport system component
LILPRRAALLVLLATAAATLVAGCGTPPQILEISPSRGASNVGSSDAIKVRFDRPMDERSVADHFKVMPTVKGTLEWITPDELAFEHNPLEPSSSYQVILEPGYRDAQGNVNSLRHSWSFSTESAPTLSGSGPGSGDRGVDPAAYLSLTFSRQMDPSTLTSAISLAPEAPFAIHQDASDPRRVVLAPQSLLQPRTDYRLTVDQDAKDVDGNRLGSVAAVSFTTGPFRPLNHWISFIATPPPTVGAPSPATTVAQTGGGLWVVDENKLPRQLVGGTFTAFSWSDDGSHVLLRNAAGGWTDQPLDGPGTTLPVTADWADYLAPGHGYAFLSEGTLQLLQPDGSRVVVAGGVMGAAVAPGGERLAFVTRDAGGATEIDGYDTDLRSRYRIQTEADQVDGLTWSPDGLSLAYRLDTVDPNRYQIRVRSLRDGTTSTVATGAVSVPAWVADRQHIAFTALVQANAGGTVSKAFRFTVGDGVVHSLTASTGMPSASTVQVSQLMPSPDGHQLAFLSSAGGRSAVFTMNADGTGLAQLTDPDPTLFPYSCREVAWTPS